MAIGGPPSTDHPNVVAVGLFFFVRLHHDAVNPQLRRHRTEVDREALTVEIHLDRHADRRKRGALRLVVQRFLDLTRAEPGAEPVKGQHGGDVLRDRQGQQTPAPAAPTPAAPQPKSPAAQANRRQPPRRQP